MDDAIVIGGGPATFDFQGRLVLLCWLRVQLSSANLLKALLKLLHGRRGMFLVAFRRQAAAIRGTRAIVAGRLLLWGTDRQTWIQGSVLLLNLPSLVRTKCQRLNDLHSVGILPWLELGGLVRRHLPRRVIWHSTLALRIWWDILPRLLLRIAENRFLQIAKPALIFFQHLRRLLLQLVVLLIEERGFTGLACNELYFKPILAWHAFSAVVLP